MEGSGRGQAAKEGHACCGRENIDSSDVDTLAAADAEENLALARQCSSLDESQDCHIDSASADHQEYCPHEEEWQEFENHPQFCCPWHSTECHDFDRYSLVLALESVRVRCKRSDREKSQKKEPGSVCPLRLLLRHVLIQPFRCAFVDGGQPGISG